MNQTVSDIKRPFLDVYKALDVKTQRKAMKGAMRREGNRLKKAAVANLGSSGIGKGTKRSLSSGIYVRTYPDRYGLGFMEREAARQAQGHTPEPAEQGKTSADVGRGRNQVS